MRHLAIRPFLILPLLLAAPAFTGPAEAGTRVKVSADRMRAVNTPQGEAAKAEGNVTIEIPGQLRIKTPVAQLLKGKDGKLERVVFPGEVKMENLKPSADGQWKSVENRGGYYDLRTGVYTELSPDGYFELPGPREPGTPG